jgi:hypothetical protein
LITSFTAANTLNEFFGAASDPALVRAPMPKKDGSIDNDPIVLPDWPGDAACHSRVEQIGSKRRFEVGVD